MLSIKLMVGQLLAGLAIGVQAMPAIAELSPQEINSIARQTTVLIAPGLTPELRRDLEENRNNPVETPAWHPGSGAIVAREGNKYYVLTVAHNFFQRYLDNPKFWQNSGGTPFYGIRTWDGEVHKIEGVNDGRGCPLRGTPKARALIRFGCRDRFVRGTETVDRNVGQNEVKGIDLAIISFTSSKDYAVASLGDASTVKIGDRVYISGWPDPEKEQAQAGGQSVRPVARRQRRLAWGSVGAKLSPDASHVGYSIFYTDCTREGMSGGPVFDKDGRLVGNHGLGSHNKQSCGSEGSANSFMESRDGRDASGQAADANSLSQRFSSSQQVNKALELLQQMGLRLPFNFQMPNAELINRGLAGQAVQVPFGSSGRVEFDIAADRTSGAFDDPSDVIPDIYKEYSSFSGLGSRVRDNPSGGCGTILLGEPCP